MLGHNPFYHRTTRRYVSLFGSLFNDLFIERFAEDGTKYERMKVPLAYAPKEKFIQRITADPTLTKSIQLTLPRISFEMNGISYDQTRKQQSLIRFRAPNTVTPSSPKAQYVGVPYDYEFSVSIYVRNIEDGLQIVEQILPFFTPDYTVKASLETAPEVVKTIPIILKSVSENINYEGALPDGERMVIWDLTFTLKGYVFGPVSNTAIIMGVSANSADPNAAITGGVYVNLYTDTNNKDLQKVYMTSGNGTFTIPEPVREPNKGITGVVSYWETSNASNVLVIAGATGVLAANDQVWGLQSGAHWTVANTEVINQKDVEIRIYQNPITATANDDYGYTTFITEYPDTIV